MSEHKEYQFPTPVIYRTGMPTAEDYAEAIRDLEKGATQLEPDGRNCVFCWDNDHQAWECRFNTLIMARRAVRQKNEWRCFHCNEVFTDRVLAAEHFGERQALNGTHDLANNSLKGTP